jgi:hypothetical protein
MLIENKGVHEPQEERAFQEVIEYVPEKCSMLELGAYWGFYSLSLLKRRPKAICFLVEPNTFNLVSGKLNFRLNGRKGHFLQAMVSEHPKKRPHTISVDQFCRENQIQHLDILHADIEGSELSMLAGARDILSQNQVDYIFISTHSSSLHASCLRELVSYGYSIIASADMNETFSVDGLIVASRAGLNRPGKIDISKKSAQQGAGHQQPALRELKAE